MLAYLFAKSSTAPLIILKILGCGNFLMRLDDTKDMVVQVIVAQITVDGTIGLDCLRSNAGLIDLQNSMLEVDGRRVSLKYAGKLGCFLVVAPSERSTSALSFFKNVSFASTNISVSYVSLFIR
jgi:hypothetical protein